MYVSKVKYRVNAKSQDTKHHTEGGGGNWCEWGNVGGREVVAM
jgi:hypothetical protein